MLLTHHINLPYHSTLPIHPTNTSYHQVGRDYAREEYAFDEKQQRGMPQPQPHLPFVCSLSP